MARCVYLQYSQSYTGPFGHIGRVAGLNLDHLVWGLGCPWQQVLLFWFVLSCSTTSCLVLALVLGFVVFGVRLLA